MDWVVKNALSRDTEREHLNKILAEIKARIDGGVQPSKSLPTSSTPSYSPGSGSSGGGSGSGSAMPKPVKITLTGDVTGEASGTTVISIPTVVTNPGLSDAPVDGSAYWRLDGSWDSVPAIVRALSGFDADGFLSWNSDDGSFEARLIVGDEEWTTSTNSDGFDGDPMVLLTEDAKEGYQRMLANASATVHGQRAVVLDGEEVRHPSLSSISDATLIAGIARTSGSVGEEINVQTGGVMREPSWSWSNGPVYVDDDGVLTQVAPTTGYIVSVGRAILSDAIDIDISLALIRS